MKYADVNKVFTDKVAEYIAKGYVINSSTMDGHQGEIAKVDLTDGKEIIRVNLESKNGYEMLGDGKSFWYTSVVITVGRCTNRVAPNSKSTWDTFWTSTMEILEQTVFYHDGDYYGGKDWYVSREEAIEHFMVRLSRVDDNQKCYLSDSARKIVLPYVKRQRGYKSAKLDDVTAVYKMADEHGKMEYYAVVKQNFIRIGSSVEG